MEQGSLISIDLSMVIQILNFLFILYIFHRLFSKKIGGVIEERKKIALKDLEEVKAEREKLEEQKNLAEKLRKESKKRANDIIIKAERQADERKDQILQNANLTRERMIMKAEAEIVKMKQKAKQELKQEVGQMAVELAEKILSENLNSDEKLKMQSIDNFINEIGE